MKKFLLFICIFSLLFTQSNVFATESTKSGNGTVNTVKIEDKQDKKETQKNKDEKIIYLTIDDGVSKLTGPMLDILKKENVKATFFVCGSESKSSKELYKRIVEEGHVIANHSYSHDYTYLYSDPENFKKDFEKLEKLIQETTGIQMTIFRFPGGSNSSTFKKYPKSNFTEIKKYLEEKGYDYFDWNVSAEDATGKKVTKDDIVKNVINNLKKGENIVLLHNTGTKKETLEAMPIIIKKAKEKGYTFDVLTNGCFVCKFKK